MSGILRRTAGDVTDAAVLLAMADVLQRQRAFGMAAPLLEVVQQTVKDRQPLLALYQKQINAAWPGLGNRLTLTAGGQFQLDFSKCKQVTTLEPLKGMALGRLQLGDCDAVQDLTPLQGMPLTHLSLHGCLRVENLAPLEGMKLEDLNLSYTAIRQVAPLRGMPLTIPVEGMKLEMISFAPKNITRGISALRAMKSLKFVDVAAVRTYAAEDFWPRYDAGEFR